MRGRAAAAVRSFEYDTPDDRYANFLIDEFAGGDQRAQRLEDPAKRAVRHLVERHLKCPGGAGSRISLGW